MANNTGTFFNVNDNDGIPLVGVSTNGKVMINHLYGNCLIGSTSVTGTADQKLQVTGGAYVSGNLGIGTTNPLTKLDVRGVITAGSDRSTQGTEILRGYYNDGALSVIGSEYSSGGLVLGYAVKPSTTTPGQFYSSTGISIDRSAYVVASSGGISPHRWYIGANQTVAENSSVTISEVMRLDGSGNLGIGTTTATGTASQRLQVTGGAYVSGSVGVGTTNPTSKLHVVGGDIRVGINTSSGVILTDENGTKYRLIVSTAGILSTVLVA